MRKTKGLMLGIIFLFLLMGLGTVSNAQESELLAEETADLYQCGALEADSGRSFYSLESDELKQQIYEDLSQVKENTDVSAYGLHASEIKVIYEAVVNNHPELFYVSNQYLYHYNADTEIVTQIDWIYLENDKNTIEEMRSDMEERITDILALTDESMTDVEKLMILHEALIMNTSYSDQTAWQNGSGCYTAYCALAEGDAVCQGYALAFELLSERLGIDTQFVGSTELNNAWNYVILNGEGYHIDCTWDDTEGKNGEISHKNFLLSDSGIRSTGHVSWNNQELSAANGFFDDFYWRRPEYGKVFVKKDGYWYQIDHVDTGFDKLCGIWLNEDSVSLYGYTGDEWYEFIIGIEEQKWIGENILEPDFLTSITSVEFSQEEYEVYKGEFFFPSLKIVPQGTDPDIWWFSEDESIATVEADGQVDGIKIGSTRIYAVVDGIVRDCTVHVRTYPVKVYYQTHEQSYGWQDWVSDGEMSGTSGQAKRLEAIRMSVHGNWRLGIEYRTHVQSYGWQDWVSNGAMSGTSGQAKRLEAIEIRLTEKDAEDYDIYYRVHAQSYGWLGWAKNGESAGTAGLSKRLEAIEIVIVQKGEPAPGTTENCFICDTPSVIYQTHVQSYGWQNAVKDGQLSGTSGEAKRLEAICIELENESKSDGIMYQTHVQSYGWQDWVSNGALSGTSGESKRLEAIRIQLTGQIAEKYDVYYRVHVQTYGWQNWVKNGAVAGTSGESKRLEAIEIKLVPKGTPVSGL